jgi:hypothetical protein
VRAPVVVRRPPPRRLSRTELQARGVGLVAYYGGHGGGGGGGGGGDEQQLVQWYRRPPPSETQLQARRAVQLAAAFGLAGAGDDGVGSASTAAAAERGGGVDSGGSGGGAAVVLGGLSSQSAAAMWPESTLRLARAQPELIAELEQLMAAVCDTASSAATATATLAVASSSASASAAAAAAAQSQQQQRRRVALRPMPRWQRALTHTMAKAYGLGTGSYGVEPERRVDLFPPRNGAARPPLLVRSATPPHRSALCFCRGLGGMLVCCRPPARGVCWSVPAPPRAACVGLATRC